MQENFEKFMSAMEREPQKGLRVNLLSGSAAQFRERFEFPLEPTPFCDEGFSLPSGFSGGGHHPLHHAGAFYLQEPSAMSAVTVLDPQPGERVLDLCAAPGGKSTQIAGRMAGKGILFSNEYVFSRAKILLSNLERCGVSNAVVVSMRPDDLCGRFPEYFDKILVDAPCSGEGMFRKDPGAVKEWSLQQVQACANRQQAILESAKEALRPGGILVYSTCTFSPEENEGTILNFLNANPDFQLMDCGVTFGSPCRPAQFGGREDAGKMRRIFPFQGGEGHFVAKLQKAGEPVPIQEPSAGDSFGEVPDEVRRFWDDWMTAPPRGKLLVRGDVLVEEPWGVPDLSGLTLLRCGVEAGRLKKGRIEPAHHLSHAYPAKAFARTVDLPLSDPMVTRYLRGETIPCSSDQKGFCVLTAGGYPLGWGKAGGGTLKNHYPKGLREF